MKPDELVDGLRATTRRVTMRAALIIGGLVLSALLAMAVVPLFVSQADLRRIAVDAIMQATGQRVAIKGEAEFKFSPLPRVHFSNLEFPLPGGTLDAQGAVARLNMWSLLFGQIEVADVTLESPTLVLTSTASAPPVAVAALVVSPHAPELRVVHGTVVLRASNGLTRELVSGIDARLVRISGGRGLSVVSQFNWRDEDCDARLSIANAIDFAAGRPSDARLEMSSGASRLRFRGIAAGGGSLGAKGEVSGDTPMLRKLLSWVGVSASIRGGLGPFSFSGTLQANRHAVSLTALSVRLDGNQSEGALSVKLDGERPMIQGTLAADDVDMTPYGRVRLIDGATDVWDARPLHLAMLSKLDLDFRFSALRVRMDETLFEQVATSAVLRSGRLSLAVGGAHAWGGDMRAALTLAPEGAGTSIRVEAEGNGVALDRALDDLFGIRRLEGIGNLELMLEGQGASIAQIMQSLAGYVQLSGENGSVLGIDVAQVLGRIERRPLSGSGDLRGGRTSFDTLSTKISLADGTASIDEATMTGKQVNLSLSGLISVPRRDIDLKGDAILLAPPAPGMDRPKPMFELPFMVRGPWNGAIVVLDPQVLIRRSGAAQPLLDAARSRGESEATVRSAIEQLARPSALPPVPAKASSN